MTRPALASRKLILLVADPAEQETVSAAVMHEFDLVLAGSQAEAFLVLESTAPDLIVIDARCVQAPAAACRSIRQGWSDSAQVLVLLDSDQVAERIACYEAGADDVVPLPIGDVELLAKCRVQASLRRETEMNRLKSQVIDMFAHELRTPLTGIVLAAETMKATGKSEGDSETWLDLMLECARRLELLSEHGLLLCRLRSDMLDVEVGEIGLGPIVARVVRAAKSQAHAHGVELTFQQVGAVRAMVDGRYFETLVRFMLEAVLPISRSGSALALSLRGDDQHATLTLTASTADPAARGLGDFEPRTEGGQVVGGRIGMSLVRELSEAQGGSFEVITTPSGDICMVCTFDRRMPERRRGRRVRPSLKTGVTVPERLSGTLVDCSTTGCLIRTDEALPVRIEVGESLVDGHVVRANFGDDAVHLGVQFDVPLTSRALARVLGRRRDDLVD